MTSLQPLEMKHGPMNENESCLSVERSFWVPSSSPSGFKHKNDVLLLHQSFESCVIGGNLQLTYWKSFLVRVGSRVQREWRFGKYYVRTVQCTLDLEERSEQHVGQPLTTQAKTISQLVKTSPVQI